MTTHRCGYCGGDGKHPDDPRARAKCPACGGSGVEPPEGAIVCPDCEDDETRGCMYCHHRGWVRPRPDDAFECRYCKGVGCDRCGDCGYFMINDGWPCEEGSDE